MAKIPLSVSSTLTTLSGISAASVTPYANETGKTGEAAPVLIAIESKNTVTAEEFAARLPALGGEGTEEQARLVLNAFASVLEDLVDEYGAITVQTPLGTIETFVSGALENATDEVDPLENVPFLGLTPPAALAKQFASIAAYVPAAACPATIKRILDVATGASEIRGTNPFYIEGTKMSYGSQGETVKLLNAITRAEVCTVAIDATTKSPVKLKGTLPATATIPAGTYILQVVTLAGGGEAGGTLWPLELRVRLAEGVAPTKRVIKMTTLTANMMGETCTVETTGENFADVQNYSESGGYVTVPCKYSINGGADVDGGFMGSPSNPLTLNISTGVSAGDTIKVTLTPDPAKTDVDQNLVEKTAVAA